MRSMVTDEGPSLDDLNRFGSDEGYCPECGNEIWDQAQACPSCGTYLAGHTSSRPPIEADWRRRWIVLVAIIAMLAFLFVVLL